MEHLSVPQRTKIVEFYLLSQKSIILTQRRYRAHFNTRDALTKKTIRAVVAKFGETGSVRDRSKTGRPRSARNPENIERVRESLNDVPSTSTRRRSNELELTRTSLRRVLKLDLHFFPYKIQLCHEIKPRDKQQRLQCSIALQQFVAENPDFIHQLIMSDEAHFHLNGYVNKQNMRFWDAENPRIIEEKELHPIACARYRRGVKIIDF